MWSKNSLEWKLSPGEALETMIAFNHKYTLAGRDPDSYRSIFWRHEGYECPWDPERTLFGSLRYRSSASAACKTCVREHLLRYGAA